MIQEFLNYEQANRGLSTRTVNEYGKDLRNFVIWARPLNLRWSTISKQHIDQYVANEASRGMKPETIKKRVTALRTLFAYAIHQGLLKENPAQYVSTPKRRSRLPQVCSLSSIDAWLQQTPTNNEEWEAQAIASILVETGLRLSELTNLQPKNFIGNHQIKLAGKGGKERIVIYGKRTERHFFSFIQANRQLPTAIKERYYRRILFQYGGKYAKGLHPHMLRHTFATEMLNAGVDLKTLSILMGHCSIQTTEIYTHLSTKTLTAGYAKFN